MSAEPVHLQQLCPILRPLLDAELLAGNRISYTQLRGGEIRVMLAMSFRARHSLNDQLTFEEPNDPHWWKPNYRCACHGHLLGCQFG